jgi:SAM-dependent methyltransferase
MNASQAMPEIIGSFIRRSRILVSLYYMIDDQISGLRELVGKIDTDSGVRHAGLDVTQSVSYIERVYEDYLRYGKIDKLRGRVCEIGPGDSFGVALLMLGHGAEEVHAIDRFKSKRDPLKHHAIYSLLSQKYGLSRFFDGAPSESSLQKVRYHPGCPAESFFRSAREQFDLVISRAVMEHLYDPIAALDDMHAALAGGGTMVHRVDLRDHGMFRGQHPLTFLTIPDAPYKAMTRRSGRPNRVLFPAYRNWLTSHGVNGDIRITRLAGVTQEIPVLNWHEIDPDLRRQAIKTVSTIRHSLARSLRSLADEELAIAGFVIRCRK